MSHKLIAKKELTRVIVDSTVQEKAIAHPTDSKLLETARAKVVEAAKTHGIELKQTFAKGGQAANFKAGSLCPCAPVQTHAQGHPTPAHYRRSTTARSGPQDEHSGPGGTGNPGPHLTKAARLVEQTGSRKTVGSQAKLYSWDAPRWSASQGQESQPV